MKAPTTLRHTRILGLGEQRPRRSMTNDELPDTLDTNDAWIRQRTGITARGVADEDETIVWMASEAARKALADSGVDPSQIGLVVLATCTLRDAIPGGAALIADAIGAGKPGAFDVNGACAGFCYALSVASDAIRLGTVDYAVVVGAERLTDWLDWSDRGSAILFGDGAGAVVVGPADEPGIGPIVFGSDGAINEVIYTTENHHIWLDGPAVFRWATTTMGGVAREICAAAGVEPSELDAVVFHQANLRIINSVVRDLGATNAVVATDVVDAGNTSAASVPMALARLRREGAVSTGDLALTLAFGAGLTWAGTLITVP